jgi:Spy/CpxP family protein refolding chaperone
MKQTLNLSDKQDARLRELRQAHFQQVGPLRQELFRLKGELADLSVSKKPDEKKVSEVAGLIGRQHEKLALLESRHLQELSTVLNRKQIDMLLKMKESRGFRRGGGWR